MKKSLAKKIFSGVGIMAACSVIGKAIGMFYRIPLTNLLGAEGIGMYQLVFPLYSVMLCISSGGLNVAVAKSVAAHTGEGQRVVFKAAIFALSGLGVIGSVAVAVLSRVIASLQGNARSALAYAAISPSVALVALIACFRGYFQGRLRLLPTAVSQISEQAVKLCVGLLFAALLLPRGIVWAVAGAAAGVTASEAVTLVLLIVWYRLDRIRQRKSGESADMPERGETVQFAAAVRQLLKIAVPVSLGSLVLPLTQVADSMLIVNILVRGGAASANATALYGIVTGPVMSLINMPAIITAAQSTALLPEVSRAVKNGEAVGAARLRKSAVIGAAMSVMLLLGADIAMKVLYRGGLDAQQLRLAASLVRVGSVSVFYVGVLQIFTAILQGSDKAHLPVIALVTGAGVKIALTAALLPKIGIAGAVAGSAACYGFTAVTELVMCVCLARRQKEKAVKLSPNQL